MLIICLIIIYDVTDVAFLRIIFMWESKTFKMTVLLMFTNYVDSATVLRNAKLMG